MQKVKKLTSLLFAVSILISMMVTAPTALAAEGAKWVEKAPMATARSYHGSAVIEGKIYIIGGSSTQNRLSSMEIYNPETNTWTTGKSMPTARSNFGIAVYDGKIYVIGGSGDSNQENSVYIYDKSNDSWTTGAPMPTARYCLKAVTANGKIYAIGGVSGSKEFSTVEIYDPVSNSWTTGSPSPVEREGFGCTVINNKIYMIGGITSAETNRVDIYDIKTDKWTSGTPMPESREGLSTITVGNKIYAMGGQKGARSSNTVYIYDATSDKWSNGPSMIQPRYFLDSAFVNNTIYTFGGNIIGISNFFNSMEALELSPAATDRKLAILLNVGETTQLSVSFDLADNASLTWSSSNQGVATVDANGKVTAVGKGDCDISAQNADGTWKQSIPVRVLPGTANMYRLAVHMKPAQNAKLHLTDNPADTTWKSLDPAVATIDAAGKVTAVAQGLVIMEGTANGETKQIYVRVKG